MRLKVLKDWREDFWAMPCIPKREIFRKYRPPPSRAITIQAVSPRGTFSTSIPRSLPNCTHRGILAEICQSPSREGHFSQVSPDPERFGG